MQTPAQRYIATVRRRLAKAEPEVARAYLASLRKLVASIPGPQVEALIRSGGIDKLVASHFADSDLNLAFSRFNASVQRTTADGVLTFARDIPGAAKSGVEAVFGVINPRVVETIRTLNDRVMGRLRSDVRESVRAIIEHGYTEGMGPKATGRLLREWIGLGPSEVKQVANFRDALLQQNGRNWRDYERRDHRFDSVIERAHASGKGLTEAQVDRMADAYARRRLALSAEANARTATLNAYKGAQQAAWQTAVDQGIIDGMGLMKEWTTVGDSRVRPEHEEMSGEVVPFDEAYSNGEMVPGEFDWNCRCWSRMFASTEAPTRTAPPAPPPPEPPPEEPPAPAPEPVPAPSLPEFPGAQPFGGPIAGSSAQDEAISDVVRTGLTAPGRDTYEFVQGMHEGFAKATGYRGGVQRITLGEQMSGSMEGARAFQSSARGIVYSPQVTEELKEARRIALGERRVSYSDANGLRTLIHENYHAVSPMLRNNPLGYTRESGRFLEEAMVEHKARLRVVEALQGTDLSTSGKTALDGFMDNTAGSYQREVRALRGWLSLGPDSSLDELWAAQSYQERNDVFARAVREWAYRMKEEGLLDEEHVRHIVGLSDEYIVSHLGFAFENIGYVPRPRGIARALGFKET